MSLPAVCRREARLLPDSSRVIIRPFIPGNDQRITTLLGRVLALDEEETERGLEAVRAEFASRHLDIEASWQANFERVRRLVFTHRPLSRSRELLLGAFFSSEYALESAALFNPSIVPHPDQSGLEEGALRFLVSLRATGEGHISSIEFRSGVIARGSEIRMDPVSRFASATDSIPNPDYEKKAFVAKLRELGFDNEYAISVMQDLPRSFSRKGLQSALDHARRLTVPETRDLHRTLDCIQWLADSNYEIQFPPALALSERVIFPISPTESKGIEDARFVRFVEDDGSTRYYATYTAYDGRAILSQLIETDDFLHFKMSSLVGDGVRNKGMAIFPRRVGGRYAMLGRQDDENIFIMFSDDPQYWSDPQLLLRPAELWESVKVGNCGSPIETEAG
ncbi:MAG TPA: glycosidase, partial [Rectinemataceae bacterium]|nr:glycosidase [Rectinemataceae bacterium]